MRLKLKVTYRVLYREHVTIMPFCFQVFGNVSEEVEMVAILACAKNVADFVLTDHALEIGINNITYSDLFVI